MKEGSKVVIYEFLLPDGATEKWTEKQGRYWSCCLFFSLTHTHSPSLSLHTNIHTHTQTHLCTTFYFTDSFPFSSRLALFSFPSYPHPLCPHPHFSPLLNRPPEPQATNASPSQKPRHDLSHRLELARAHDPRLGDPLRGRGSTLRVSGHPDAGGELGLVDRGRVSAVEGSMRGGELFLGGFCGCLGKERGGKGQRARDRPSKGKFGIARLSLGDIGVVHCPKTQCHSGRIYIFKFETKVVRSAWGIQRLTACAV